MERMTILCLLFIAFFTFPRFSQALPPEWLSSTSADIKPAVMPPVKELKPIGPVHDAGSDDASRLFQEKYLPGLSALVDQKLNEYSGVDKIETMAVDPSKLLISSKSAVRVYFLGEGAGFHNTLGFTSKTQDAGKAKSAIIFPDASSSMTYMSKYSKPVRSPLNPLLPGDFVDLGSYEPDTRLDFFLVANGAYGGTTTFSTDSSLNRDNVQHVVALAMEDSPFLVLGFEDLWGGGDRDYNDLVVAIDMGTENVAHMTNAPEPGTLLLLSLATTLLASCGAGGLKRG